MGIFRFSGLEMKTGTETPLAQESITLLREGEVSEYLIQLVFEGEVSPKTYSIAWQEARVDTVGQWSPSCGTSRSIGPNWARSKSDARTACGMPLLSLFGADDGNRLTLALSDTATPTSLQVGTIEENGRLDLRVMLFTNLTSPMREYEAVLRIDRRKQISFATAAKEVRAWWSERGLACAHVPDDARKPMYSTWYSYHQKVFAEEILAECRLAKELGMDTVIVDDGWQTDDNSRGYAYCGDWQVAAGKIPDMRAFVDALHAMGMKIILWYSVPFVGEKSENYQRFRGKYLSYTAGLHTYVLDPRYPEVRDFLADTYARAVQEFDLDGLKLDFIDRFTLLPESTRSAEGMDTVSVEEGVDLLLREVTERLHAVKPDVMLEFRQPYIGPIVAKYGNLFRVGDCPSDPIRNRVGTLDLRLTAGTCCVHSDMIMWHPEETPEGMATQLWGVLFSVPQISVRIARLTQPQRKALCHYLTFWLAHRETLLDGMLEVEGVQANYTLATATGKDEAITAVYAQRTVNVGATLPHYVFNITGKEGLYLALSVPCTYEILDVCGERVASGEAEGIAHLPVPNGGSVCLTAK